MGDRSHDAARTAVRDDEITVRQHLVLWDVSRNPHVLRLRSKGRRVTVRADGGHDIHRQSTETVEHRCVQLVRREHRAEREIHGRPFRGGVSSGHGSGSERNGSRRQGRIRVAESWWERGQHETAIEHGELRVGREPVLVAQCMEWFCHEALAKEPSGRQHNHADTGEPEPFCSDCGTKIDLVADNDVGVPRAGHLENRRRMPPGALSSEVLSEVSVFFLRIDPAERLRLTRLRARLTRRECEEPCSDDRGPEIARTGHTDRVPSALGGARDGYQRLEVAPSADEREQNAHRVKCMECLGRPHAADIDRHW